MFLVADSGSSKADWYFVSPNGKESLVSTIGINPNLHSTAEMTNVVVGAAPTEVPKARVERVFYYGTGIWDHERSAKLATILRACYPKASVEVHHDLLGAARAACGTASGVACILGTGSNSCLYDGSDVVDNVTNLGWLLGDEGSGVDLGRRLVKAFSYRELPEEDRNCFIEETGYNRQTIGDALYGSGSPNRFLASFSPFIHDNLHRPAVKNIVEEAFQEFFRRHVLKYKGVQDLPVNFIGSISHHYADVLREVAARCGLSCGEIKQKPIHALVDYHRASFETSS